MNNTDAADVRPPEFDARLLSYLPYLRSLAKRLTTRDEADDLASETVIKALSNWQKFRPDGGFVAWLRFTMRGILSNKRRVDGLKTRLLAEGADSVSPPINMAALIDAKHALAAISGSDIAHRIAEGSTQRELANESGISQTTAYRHISKIRADLKARGLAPC